MFACSKGELCCYILRWQVNLGKASFFLKSAKSWHFFERVGQLAAIQVFVALNSPTHTHTHPHTHIHTHTYTHTQMETQFPYIFLSQQTVPQTTLIHYNFGNIQLILFNIIFSNSKISFCVKNKTENIFKLLHWRALLLLQYFLNFLGSKSIAELDVSTVPIKNC